MSRVVVVVIVVEYVNVEVFGVLVDNGVSVISPLPLISIFVEG